MSIEWKVIKDPDDGSNEYQATVGGIEFYIWRSTDAGFGLTAHRLSNNAPLHGRNSIAWLRSKKNCVAHAERILQRETATIAGSAERVA